MNTAKKEYSNPGGLGPLSFSMNSIAEHTKELESPTDQNATIPSTNSLNRRRKRKNEDRDSLCRSWGPMDEDGNKDFWASIEEPYNYIMESQLVPDVYEINEKGEFPANSELELSWDMDDVSPSFVWNFSQFLEQYNELYEWLIQVQVELYNPSTFKDKVARVALQEELKRQTYRKKLFIEHCGRVVRRYPTKEDEISWRVNYLTNKWEQLETAFTPTKCQQQEVPVELDLEHEEKVLNNWLITMEGHIQPITCRLPKGCSIQTLQDRYKDNEILQKDIAAHGPVLKDVIRQYETRADISLEDEAIRSVCVERTVPQIVVSRENKRIPRRVRGLEKRWHRIYLRSLEWNIYLEGVIANFKNYPCSCSSNSDDEPLTKCRKLSFNSSVSSTGSAPRAAKGWSDYENHGSDSGSYIEYVDEGIVGAQSHVKDDYVVTSVSPSRSPLLLVTSESSSLKFEPMLVEDQEHCAETILENEQDMNEPIIDQDSHSDMKGKDQDSHSDVKGKDQENCNLSTDVSNLSQNYRSFVYKHQDCAEDRKVKHVVSRRLYPAKPWKNRYQPDDLLVDEDAVQEGLQKIIDDAYDDSNWLKSNIPTDSEGSVDSRQDGLEDLMDIVSDGSVEQSPVDVSDSCCAIKKLIKGAEKLVREPEKGLRDSLKPLIFEGTHFNNRRRTKQWIRQQCDSSLQDSCDASGELTTGESDVESNASEKECFFGPKHLSKSSVCSFDKTPTGEVLRSFSSSTPKLNSRGKKRRQNDQRPWSITDVAQLPAHNPQELEYLKQNIGDKRYEETETVPMRNKNFSSSESALNQLKGSSSDTAVEGKTPTIAYSDLIGAMAEETLFSPMKCDSSQTAEEGNVSSPPATSGDAAVYNSRSSTVTSSLKRRKIRLRRKSNTSVSRRSLGSESDQLTKSIFGRMDAIPPQQIDLSGISHMDQTTLLNEGCISIKTSERNIDVIAGGRQVRTPTSDLEPGTVPEDIGILSEQDWDSYQDTKYLSEPYSEDVDHDAAKRLLYFGDDYRQYIDSDGSSRIVRPPRPLRSKKPRPQGSVRSTSEFDSDPHLESIHQILKESKISLQQAEVAFRRCCNDPALSVDLQVIIATASNHIDALTNFITALQKEKIGLGTEMKEAQGIVRQWENLGTLAKKRQRHLPELLQFQKEIKAFKTSLEEIDDQCESAVRLSSLDTPVELQQKIQIAKDYLATAKERREELTALNQKVLSNSNLLTIPLKDDLSNLYQLWDEIQLRISGKISKLEGAQTIWRLWEEQKMDLQNILKQDSDTLKVLDKAIQSGNAQDVARLLSERRNMGLASNGVQVSNINTNPGDLTKLRSRPGHLSDSGTSGYESCSSDDLSERERRLANLRRLARDLEATLVPGSKAYSEISETIVDAEKQLSALQKQRKDLLDRTTGVVCDDIEISRPEIENLPQKLNPSSLKSKKASRLSKESVWIKRIVRMAIPFQAAILLLLCVACLMEPNCCDSANTLNFNINPQLRFINGPPPV